MEPTTILKKVLVFQRVVAGFFNGDGTLLVALEMTG
jgi:hypothetical protein